VARRYSQGRRGALKIRDRIKELRRVRASELAPNPRNWRTQAEGVVDGAGVHSLPSLRARRDRQGAGVGGAVSQHCETCSVSPTALFRHRDHLPQTLIKATEAQEISHADNLIVELGELVTKARVPNSRDKTICVCLSLR